MRILLNRAEVWYPVIFCKKEASQDYLSPLLGKSVLGKRSVPSSWRREEGAVGSRDYLMQRDSHIFCLGVAMPTHITLYKGLQQLQADLMASCWCEPRWGPTWLKLSRALWRFACIPVGASLVILMEFSRMPWGMMWLSGEGAGSALMKTRKSWWLPSLCCSSFFSRELSHLATRWMFWQGQREQDFVSPLAIYTHAEQATSPSQQWMAPAKALEFGTCPSSACVQFIAPNTQLHQVHF